MHGLGDRVGSAGRIDDEAELTVVVTAQAGNAKAGRRERDPGRVHVCDVHAESTAQERQSHQQSLGANADHEGRLWELTGKATERRLDHSQRLHTHEISRLEAPDAPGQVRWDDDLLSQSSGPVHPDRPSSSACRRPAAMALRTVAARDIGLDHDQLPQASRLDVLADSLDGPECLVPHDPRVAGCCPLPTEHAQIGPAQPDAGDGDAHVTRPDLGLRHIIDDDAARFDQQRC